jgi:kinetochore protein Nuf2
LVQIIADLNNAINNEKANLVQLEKKSREIQVRLETVTRGEDELYKCNKQIMELDLLFKDRDQLLRQVKEVQDGTIKQQSTLRDKEIRLEQLNRQLTSTHEKLNRLHSQQQSKREQVQQRLKELKDEYEVLSTERNKIMEKIDHTERLIKEMEVKVNPLVKI